MAGAVTFQPSGIEGLTGRDPIGAAMTIGRKGPRGNPIDTDRFYIVLPQEEGGIRPPHPAFAGFNFWPGYKGVEDADARTAYELAEKRKRQTVRGLLVHARRAECFEYYLRAQVLPGKPPHPKKRPACMGDGKTALRYGSKSDDDFTAIPCPNEKCEFRKSVGEKPVPCKPFMRFLFRPVWSKDSPLPTPLTKLTSGSWNTTAAFLGFFDYIDAQAKALGVPDYTLYGLPFLITLARKKRTGDAASARAFPILSITPDVDLQSFLYSQQDRAQLYARPVAALTDHEQHDPHVIDADYRSVNPGISPDDNARPPRKEKS